MVTGRRRRRRVVAVVAGGGRVAVVRLGRGRARGLGLGRGRFGTGGTLVFRPRARRRRRTTRRHAHELAGGEQLGCAGRGGRGRGGRARDGRDRHRLVLLRRRLEAVGIRVASLRFDVSIRVFALVPFGTQRSAPVDVQRVLLDRLRLHAVQLQRAGVVALLERGERQDRHGDGKLGYVVETSRPRREVHGVHALLSKVGEEHEPGVGVRHAAEVVHVAGHLERLDQLGALHVARAEFPQRERLVRFAADDQRVFADPRDGRECAVGILGEGLEGGVHGRSSRRRRVDDVTFPRRRGVDADGSVGVGARERAFGGEIEVVD